jgi:hypothetical protein
MNWSIQIGDDHWLIQARIFSFEADYPRGVLVVKNNWMSPKLNTVALQGDRLGV